MLFESLTVHFHWIRGWKGWKRELYEGSVGHMLAAHQHITHFLPISKGAWMPPQLAKHSSQRKNFG